jgi:hypothetical protein
MRTTSGGPKTPPKNRPTKTAATDTHIATIHQLVSFTLLLSVLVSADDNSVEDEDGVFYGPSWGRRSGPGR